MIGYKTKSVSTVLGLFLDEPWLHVAVCKKNGRGFKVVSGRNFNMSLKFLTGEPELIGREIRNHLDSIGVKERHCVVALPLSYAMQARIELPELQGEDLRDYLSLQVEKEFPRSHDELSIALSNFKDPEGRRSALIHAVPLDHIQKMERVIRAARLHMESLTLAPIPMTGLLATSEGKLPALVVDEKRVELFLRTEEGLVYLRTLEELTEEDSLMNGFQHATILLELRITLAQITPYLGGDLSRQIRIIRARPGSASMDALENDLETALTEWGWAVKRQSIATLFRENQADMPDKLHPAAWAVAGEWLNRGGGAEFEFKPPKITPIRQFITRFASKSNKWMGTAAAVIVLAILLVFLLQGRHLSNLEKEWASMESKVESLNQIQDRIRQFRGWFDPSCPALTKASVLTEMFPAQGDVWAKSIEIKSDGQIVCTGFARSRDALLDMLAKMEGSDQILDLQVQQMRGQNPIQFIVKYVYSMKGSS